MDKEFAIGSEYEPSPETIRAFSELVEREAYRKRCLEERKDAGLLPAAAAHRTAPWQPRFRMEDFSCSSTSAVGCSPQKSGGKTTSTSTAAGAWNVSSEVEKGLTWAWKGTKRTREMIPTAVVVVDGEEKVHSNNNKKKKAAITTMQTMMKWDLNKGVEPFDDNA